MASKSIAFVVSECGIWYLLSLDKKRDQRPFDLVEAI